MSSDDNTPGQVSPEAFAEFKAQYSKEFPKDKISDAELHARADGVLRLFDLLLRPIGGETPASIQVTEEEARILAFLHQSICHESRSPSVRDVAIAAGLRSSRSGMRLIDRFTERNWLSRDTEGKLELGEWLKDCNTTFLHPEA
jgi:hypothetical protein